MCCAYVCDGNYEGPGLRALVGVNYLVLLEVEDGSVTYI